MYYVLSHLVNDDKGSLLSSLFLVVDLYNLDIICMINIFTLNNTNFLSCRLLGEFMLPLSNVLPHTHGDLHVIMKDIGMEY